MKRIITALAAAAALAVAGCGGASSYPANYQANYLNACEAGSTVKLCGCSLSYIEAHVSLDKFQAAEQAITDGSDYPQWLYDAARSCA